MSGWLIKINEWTEPTPIRLFAVAESDPRLALIAVQKLTNAAPKRRVETVRPLPSETLSEFGLKAGQVIDLTN